MARRYGIVSVLSALAREAARNQRAAETAARRAQKEIYRAQREAEAERRRAEANAERNLRRSVADQKKFEREEKSRYAEERAARVEEQNRDLENHLAELEGILNQTLDVDDAIDFDELMIREEFPEFLETPIGAQFRDRPRIDDLISALPLPSFGQRLFGGERKYRRKLAEAEATFAKHQDKWVGEFEAAYSSWQESKENFEEKKRLRNLEVEQYMHSYIDGEPETVADYSSMVLERSNYPENFPHQFQIAYVPESRQLVIEYELPSADVVPIVAEYRYTKARDEIDEKPRKQSDVVELYQDVVSAVALRTIHEVLEADIRDHIDNVCFNGFVSTVDPRTGRDIRPHLISVRVSRETFLEINLRRVDKRACLRNLGAHVSPSPEEAVPVRPIIEFDMVDKRFVDQSDILSDLEARPNLMELNPYEFEHLVANLFGQMGLESKLTRSSKDGGVDCVAFDKRPILGGKVVIQAKRYKNSVGVSAVRDLFGTMMNEGANKGILVATSGYGSDAYEFCKDKPIELIDGNGLLYLLEQVGFKARIIIA